jgi:ppGpp synthetase/RelA/SpoT-type nucleotidyltranferase
VPLTDQIIEQCVERYWRERARYQKLASFVADKCELMIESSLIRAEVSWRAKHPERLRSKLRKRSRVGGDEVVLDSVDAVFSWISDLAGVRISTYREGDRPTVVEGLRSIFVGSDGGEIEIDLKDAPGKLFHPMS